MAAGGGDVGRAGESVEADGEVAQGGHDCWPGSGANLAVVFGEDDVADPVQAVFDAPVPADCRDIYTTTDPHSLPARVSYGRS